MLKTGYTCLRRSRTTLSHDCHDSVHDAFLDTQQAGVNIVLQCFGTYYLLSAEISVQKDTANAGIYRPAVFLIVLLNVSDKVTFMKQLIVTATVQTVCIIYHLASLSLIALNISSV